MIQSRWSQNLLFVILTLVLVLLVWWGFKNGVRAAQSKRIIKDAQVLSSAFAEFKKDQNRYPADTEYEDRNVMRSYITNFPPAEFVSELCPSSFDYFNASPQTYELRFCLPKAAKGFQKGWNVMKP
jgi:hypothetical protein